MTRFEEMNNLISEITKLCETMESETNKINEQTEENKEYKYFMFCTELELYRTLAAKLNRGIEVPTNVGTINGKIEYMYNIKFNPQRGTVHLYSRGVNTTNLTDTVGKFYPFYKFEDGHKKTLFHIAKNIDWQLFEKNFAEKVEEVLTIRARLANENNEYAKKCLEESK